MPGRGKAVETGAELQRAVIELGERLGLDVEKEVIVGKRLWGASRKIDVVLKESHSRTILGIECKAQKSAGTAEQKIAATIQDMEAWPIRGLIVYSGPGFSDQMKAFLLASGKAIEFDDLEAWLKLYFVQ